MAFERCEIEILKGKVLRSVVYEDNIVGGDRIIFEVSDDERYQLYHSQSCCEQVYVESITGELQDLIGEPLLMAEEASRDATDHYPDSATWTFYKFATIKGYVDIRWVGESNGYYSESVDFARLG